MGALDYELAWIRFLRDAEVEYIHRLTRVSTSQPLFGVLVTTRTSQFYYLKWYNELEQTSSFLIATWFNQKSSTHFAVKYTERGRGIHQRAVPLQLTLSALQHPIFLLCRERRPSPWVYLRSALIYSRATFWKCQEGRSLRLSIWISVSSPTWKSLTHRVQKGPQRKNRSKRRRISSGRERTSGCTTITKREAVYPHRSSPKFPSHSPFLKIRRWPNSLFQTV